jgi:hypothetical protein
MPKQIDIEEFLALWEYILPFCSPRGVCNVEQLSRAMRSRVLHLQRNNGALQRYWNAQWYTVVWFDTGDATNQLEAYNRRQMRVSLSRSDAKKNWKEMFKEAYESRMRSVLMGHGCNNRGLARPVVEAERQSKALTPRSFMEAPSEEDHARMLVSQRPDAAFVQQCLDGGVAVEHFLRHGGGTASSKGVQDREQRSRDDYRALHNKKSKDKCRRGRSQIWEQWTEADN